MVKLHLKVVQAIEALKKAGASKSDLIKAASGRYYNYEESVKDATRVIEDYCRSDKNLETVVTGILDGYEIISAEEVAKRFSALAHIAFLINLQTDYAAFVDFSGHVKHMKISIRKGKEKQEYIEEIYQADSLTENELFGDEFEKVQEKLYSFLTVEEE